MVEPTWPGPSARHASLGISAYSQRTALANGEITRRDRSAEDASCASSDQCLARLVQGGSVCVAWNRQWAGELGKPLLFHVKRVGPDRVVAGYFAYWSTERPWGKNALTRQVLPALLIDAVYSHLLFVLPGLKSMLYGPGDVEGLRVTYTLGSDHQLVPVSVFADDGTHNEVQLDVRDAVDDSGRVVVLTNVWSHQLGAKGAVSAVRAGAGVRCYTGSDLQPVTAATALAFRLGDIQVPLRARPAWRILEQPKNTQPLKQASNRPASRFLGIAASSVRQ